MKVKALLLIVPLLISGIVKAQTAETWFDKAMNDYKNRNYTAAIKSIDKAIELAKGNDFKLQHLYMWRGKSKYFNQEYDNSTIADFQMSVHIKPDNHQGYLYLSYIYAKLKQETTACNYLDLAFDHGYKDDSISFRDQFSNLKLSECFKELLERHNLLTKDYYLPLIRDIVEEKINHWQKKGKFEKTVDYQIRVTEDTRNALIEQYTRSVLDSIALSQISLSGIQNEYDADNESFRLKFKGLEPIILKVPINEAQDFDKNFTILKYSNPGFTLVENKFYILYIEIYNPINNRTYKYNSQDVVAFSSTQLNLNFDEIKFSIPEDNSQRAISQNSSTNIITVGKSETDINIPVNTPRTGYTFALIIGNEDYTGYQPDLNTEVNVAYARNDARVFAEYVQKTLGIPKENIKVLYDAIGSVMKREIERVIRMAQMTRGEVLFYYAGHGFPDEDTKEAYIMPVDITGSNVREGIRLGKLYEQLSDTMIQKATVFLDACFSGGGRSQGLLAARGVRIKPTTPEIAGNLVVFAATSEDQVSMPYHEKQHGMFTYFLLKKLQETSGNLNYKELSDYLKEQVPLNAIKINYKEQMPTLMVSPNLIDSLGNIQMLE